MTARLFYVLIVISGASLFFAKSGDGSCTVRSEIPTWTCNDWSNGNGTGSFPKR